MSGAGKAPTIDVADRVDKVAKAVKAAKPAKPGWFHGSAVDLSRRFRLLAFLLSTIIAFGLCFSQFGIMAWDADNYTDTFNIALFIIPAALCTVMLGAVPGVALAFLTGMFIFLRAQWTPVNGYDVHLADPLLSVGSITAGAILLALLTLPAARKWPPDLSPDTSPWKRLSPLHTASIIVGCLLFALAYSYGTRSLVYLIVTPGGAEYGYASMIAGYLASLQDPRVLLEVVVNGAIITAVCLYSVVQDANRQADAWRSGITAAFTRWLLFAMLVVFVASSAWSFCAETTRATDGAKTQIQSELEYMNQQLEARLSEGGSLKPVAEGYNPALGGSIVVVRNNVVVSSNNPDAVGESASKILSSGDMDNYDFLVDLATQDMLKGTSEEDGQFFGIMALRGEHFTVIEDAPLAEMYRSRTATLMYNAGFLLVMLVAVFVVVRIMLSYIVVEPIHRTNKTLALITEGELQRRIDERAVKEFDELSDGINTTVGALRTMMDEVEHRNTQDLLAAKAIQESALPREFPPFPDIDRFDIYASMKTAKEVGGDFYDFFLIDEGKLGFLIADVAGKGIPAALFMMTAKTQIKSYLGSGIPVNEAVDAANHQLCLGNDAGMFVTAWVAVLDYRTGELSYVNAGHNPPLLNHDGEWEWMREVSGMPLGLFDGLPYERLEHQLESSDTLYLYTDGVTEAMDKDGGLFGEDRLLRTLERFAGMNARSMSVGVRRAITDFTLDAEQSDDITMLTLRYGVPPEKKAVMVLPADVNQLIHVYNFIHEELKRRGAPSSVYGPLDIAAEELFVNVCHYAYPDDEPEDLGEVRIGFEYDATPPSLTVTISDDGIPYDPLAKPDAVTPDDIMDVPIGGLGILMAKRSVDDMSYERVDGSNVVTFRKSW